MNNYDRRYGSVRESAPRQRPRPVSRPISAGRRRTKSSGVFKLLTAVFFVLLLFATIALATSGGSMFYKVSTGILGLSAIALTISGMLICLLKFFGFRTVRLQAKTAFFVFAIVGVFLMFLQVITSVDLYAAVDNPTYSNYLFACFDSGAKTSGGLFVGLFAYPLLHWVGARLSLVLLAIAFFGLVFFTFLPLLLEERTIGQKPKAQNEKLAPQPKREAISLFVDTIDGNKHANKINKKSFFAPKSEDGFDLLNPNKEQEFDFEEPEVTESINRDINSEDPKVRKQAVKNILFHMDDQQASAIFNEVKERESKKQPPIPDNNAPKIVEHKPKEDDLPIFLGSRRLAQNKASEILYGDPDKTQKSMLPEDDLNISRAITPEDASPMQYKDNSLYGKNKPSNNYRPNTNQSAKEILFGGNNYKKSNKEDIRTDGNFSLFGIKRKKTEADKKLSIEDVLAKLDKPEAQKEDATFVEKDIEKKPSINDVLFGTKSFNDSKIVKKPIIKAEQITLHENIGKKHEYIFPSDALLKDYPPPKITEDFTEIGENLCNALAAYDINAEVVGHQRGPTFTQFAFRLPDGVSVKRVSGIETDIKRKLKTSEDIRIIPAIEGMDAFGIELPNQKRSTIGMRNLINAPEFQRDKKLYFVLGVDVTGTPFYCDLLSMPHLLVAGSTGSGKSVCLNTIICSFLYHYPPEVVKFIMIDPKKVELNIYNGIPHMILKTTVTDCSKAVNALSWAIAEMDKRYTKFQELGCRSIHDYNDMQEETGGEKLHYIVVIVDEMADLMTRARKDVEDKIATLASQARAAGIHLIVATQRPSVDVITGTIKNNIPTRIAFKVSAFADSKTILDKGGADKLFGRGDMLFMNAEFSEPKRLQGPFLSDSEVRDIVKFVKSNNDPDYDEEANKAIFTEKVAADDAALIEDSSDAESDPLFEEAVRFVVESKIGSISMLQRKYHIGFNRAGRLIDAMSARGIVEQLEYGTSKPRTVLITSEDVERIFRKDEDDEE